MKPIIFSAPMVRAILAGTKTMTRRVVKPQPECAEMRKQSDYWLPFGMPGFKPSIGWRERFRCPYGRVGDVLYVKEAWCLGDGTGEPAGVGTYDEEGRQVHYRADWAGIDDDVRWNSPMFMPRWASRLSLRLTAVRVERLNDISEADAKAEGVEPATVPASVLINDDSGGAFSVSPQYRLGIPKPGDKWHGKTVTHVQHVPAFTTSTAREAFASTWQSIHGPGSWAANPWVWVLAFERVTP